MKRLFIAMLIFIASAAYASEDEVSITVRMPPAPVDYVLVGDTWIAWDDLTAEQKRAVCIQIRKVDEN